MQLRNSAPAPVHPCRMWGEATDNVAILAVLANTPGILYCILLVYLWQEKIATISSKAI